MPALPGTGKIHGVVLDSTTGKPVEFAVVSLLSADFGKTVDGGITDEKGRFRLNEVKNGSYRVQVSFLGYATLEKKGVKISKEVQDVDLGKLVVSPETQTLQQVEVVAQKDLVENKIDRIIYNADRDITAKGGDATDILRKVPLVSVDLDGNVSLRGSGNVRILINGKPSNIMANSVADAMRMIPADIVEKVEVITSPSAKYDAEGTAGIINVITKKKNIEGLSGSVQASAGTRSSNLNSSLNFRSGKFGIQASGGGYYWIGLGELNTLRSNEIASGTSYLQIQGDNRNNGGGIWAQLGSDFDINDRNSLSGSFRLNGNRRFRDGEDMYSSALNSLSFQELFTRDAKTLDSGLGYDASVDYKRTFRKKDQELTFSVLANNRDNKTDYDVDQWNPFDVLDLRETGLNLSKNREYTFQVDYVHPFGKGATLETGAKSIFRNVTSDYDYRNYDFNSGQFEFDPFRSNFLDYFQDVYAGYAQVGFYIREKVGVRAGARYEETSIRGDFQQGESPFTNRFGNLIPNLTLSYTLKNKNTLKFSYTQRIQRPSLFFLNPFVNFYDPKNISYGNPKLGAEVSDSYELGYTYYKNFSSINVSAYHRFTDNAIQNYRFIQDDSILVSTYGNVGTNSSTGISVNGNTMAGAGKLILNANVNVYYFEASSADLGDNSGVNYNINGFGAWNFSEKWGVQGFCNLNGPRISVQGRATSFFFYSLGVRRNFWGKQGGASLGVDNFLNWFINFRQEFEGAGFRTETDNRILFTGLRLSVDYRFGKMEFKPNAAKKRRGIRNDDIKAGEGDNLGG